MKDTIRQFIFKTEVFLILVVLWLTIAAVATVWSVTQILELCRAVLVVLIAPLKL